MELKKVDFNGVAI